MKSIYEAAVAYGREHQGTVNIEDFEAGANYVLEQIEDIIVNNEDNTLNMARCLVDCIKQLKK